MNRFYYTVLMYLASPLIWGYLLFRAIKSSQYREGFAQRLGYVSALSARPVIMLHCASVGESRAAAPLIKSLILQYPHHTILITTTTPTGKQSVRDLFAETVEHCYLPIDWLGSCRRFILRFKPQIVILMETELWPNLLHVCSKQKIPVLLANARLSTKSLAKYAKHPKLSKQIFANIDKIAAQYESDKRNFMALGVEANKIELVGNIKFDIDISDSMLTQQAAFKYFWVGGRPAWVAASIHPGEFKSLLVVHQQLLREFPDLLLIGVPRHPEKFDEFAAACQNQHLKFVRRSQQLAPSSAESVILGDSLGEMLLYCGAANITFVGGSLIERGGHNPLEALACGLSIVMGPHFFNFSDICQLLIEHKVLQVVATDDELFGALATALNNKAELETKNQLAKNIVDSNSGCVNRLAELVSELLSIHQSN